MGKNFESKNVKVWGEHINLIQFILGLVISLSILAVTLLITHFAISKSYEAKLIAGLISVLISFIINLICIKPKRNIIVREKKHDN